MYQVVGGLLLLHVRYAARKTDRLVRLARRSNQGEEVVRDGACSGNMGKMTIKEGGKKIATGESFGKKVLGILLAFFPL